MRHGPVTFLNLKSVLFIAYLKTNKNVPSHFTYKKNESEDIVQIRMTFVTVEQL